MAKSDVLVRMKADTQNYDANIAKARRQLDQFKKDNLSMGGVLKQLNGNLLATATRFASVTAAVGALGAAFRSNIETAKNFEKSMSQLSSLTGMVGEDLGKLKEYAIELGSSTTLSASQVADAFKMIGSQQPQLLSSGEALKAVTKNAITLAEAAGIELSDAAKTLSVSINQMGGESNNAERYINVLAAAAQKGAGDIVWLGEAITKSGTTAKAVGTDYEELVANLEQLAKAGYDASTAGTALRSIIMNLEKQANNDFKPSVVGLTEAFKNLGEANLTLTEYQGIAGKMFAAQAKALADAAGEAKNMKEEITGTNIAEEQAKTNTDNLDGSLKSLASAWEGFNLHLNSSNGLFRDLVDWMKDTVVAADNLRGKLDELWGKYGWMFSNSKQGAQQGFADAFTQKYGNSDDAAYNKKLKEREEKNKQLRKYAYEHNVQYNGRYITKAEYEAEFGTQSLGNGGNGSGGGSGKGGSKTSPIPKIENSWAKAMTTSANGADKLKPSDYIEVPSVWAQYAKDIDKSMQEIDHSMDNLSFDNFASSYAQVEQHIKDMNLALQQQKMAFNMAGQAAANFGAALAGIEDPSVKAAGTVIQAIANIALGFGSAVAQASSMGPYGWIAYVAAGLGAMATAVSTVHSLTGYAEGGEIKGNSYSGDNIAGLVDGKQLVGLNAGEIVLNAAQSGHVAHALQGAGGNLHLEGILQGENILIAANRTAKRKGYGEMMFWQGG